MFQLASWSALGVGAALSLASTPARACDEDVAKQPTLVPIRQHRARTVTVLDRVDRILDTTCQCATAIAGKCKCVHPEHRIFEKLSGNQDSLQLPKEARYDASAGVFL